MVETRSAGIDVAMVPGATRIEAGGVLIVVDQIRASTTMTVALDLGCSELVLAGDVETARRLARGTGRLLAGEQHAVKPPDFDFDNSPSELSRAAIRGRGLVLCTTNGTAVVSQLRAAEHLLIGCLRNASAVAAAALQLATETTGDGHIAVVCAGLNGEFVLDDAAAAGVIVDRVVHAAQAHGVRPTLTDAAQAAVRIRHSFSSLVDAMTNSNGGATLRRIGATDDIAFCAELDASDTVPALVHGPELRIIALPGVTLA
jgi:2-phosphosulfolactate phosphatase